MSELVGKRLGEFEIVRELGRGGMGVVFEAVQTSLNRKVALKVLGPGLGLTAKAVARFRREAEAAAKLHHTNIVPVYATGEEGGFHFYAMELIDGPSLDRVIAQLRDANTTKATPTLAPELTATGPYLDTSTPTGSGMSGLSSGGAYFDTVARIVADVAEALHHAHQSGVIHRDIKPGNLLLGSDGRLSVNDFGLARALEEPGMTTTGEFVGTPAYMAPEQIAGGRIPVDHRCDVYSLGATLYELLTLRPPFLADRRDQLLAMVVQKEPAAPRRVNPQVPRDLETICLKCLEKDPDRRYQTARALADDLRRFLNRFAITARRAGPLTRARKWVKRNPALAVAAVAVLLALGAAGAFAWQAHEAEQRRVAELKAERLRAAMDRGMVAAMGADFTAARAALRDAEVLGATAGEVRVLRGFIGLYSGEPRTAVADFRAASDLLPEAVAPRALLAVALGWAGDWDESNRVLRGAEQMVVRTPEDRLFLGMALGLIDSAAGIREMRAAVRERPSGIGQVLLADALWIHAANTGSVADAEEALAAADTAGRLLPGNPFVEVTAASARMAAGVAYELAGDRPRAAAHLAEASRLADTFSGPADGMPVAYTRFVVASLRDGVTPPMRFTAALRLPGRRDDPSLAAFEAIALWRLSRVEQAAELVRPHGRNQLAAQLRIALALEEPNGRAAARAAWAELVGAGDEPARLVQAIPWLYLTGEPERVAESSRRVRASGYRSRAATPTDWDAALGFWEGRLTDAEFLAAPVSDRPQMTWRRMMVGMRRLGAGDRAGARLAFTAAYESKTFFWETWEWSQSFLVRMNTDPDWPKAIPLAKKQ